MNLKNMVQHSCVTKMLTLVDCFSVGGHDICSTHLFNTLNDMCTNQNLKPYPICSQIYLKKITKKPQIFPTRQSYETCKTINTDLTLFVSNFKIPSHVFDSDFHTSEYI